MNEHSQEYEHFLRKARDAKQGGHAAWSVQSTGEKLAVAFALNRADWLAEYGYSLADAIERVGFVWLVFIPRVARQLAYEED